MKHVFLLVLSIYLSFSLFRFPLEDLIFLRSSKAIVIRPQASTAALPLHTAFTGNNYCLNPLLFHAWYKTLHVRVIIILKIGVNS